MSSVHPMDESPIKKSSKRKIIDETKKRDVIASELLDSRDVKNCFKNYPLLPYAGDNARSGDSLMEFFFNLYKLSVTEGSCINRIGEYVIGDRIEIINIKDEYNSEVIEVTIENKEKFKQAISLGKIEENTFSECGYELYKQIKICGQGALLLSLYTTGDIKTYSLRVLDNNNYRILLDSNKKVTNFFAISEKFEEKYLKDNPPKIISKYPEFVEDQNIKGISHTIIYYKQGTKHYGRPDSIFSTQYKYSEIQNVDYRIMQTDNKWTGDLIIEAEQGDPNTNPMLDIQTYENNFTNKSENPLSVFYTERPAGAGNLFVYQVQPNSNENYYQIVGKEDRLAIISSHGWSERLLGHPSSAGINGNSFLFELYTKIPIINKNKNAILYCINIAITEILKHINESLVGLGIDYYSEILERVKSMNFENNNNATGSNQEQSITK